MKKLLLKWIPLIGGGASAIALLSDIGSNYTEQREAMVAALVLYIVVVMVFQGKVVKDKETKIKSKESVIDKVTDAVVKEDKADLKLTEEEQVHTRSSVVDKLSRVKEKLDG